MRLVDAFIQNPVKVTAGTILLVLFGLLTVTPPSIMPSPFRVPVQLTPDLDEPIVSVTTTWEGASPEEVEREIVDPQEEMLKGVSDLRKITSTSAQGQATIQLEFVVGTNQDVAKQDVSDALRRVKYQIPLNEFDNPVVQTGSVDGEKAIAWMIISSDRPDLVVPQIYTFIFEDVKPILERVEGVASVRVFGGREREVHVVVDGLKLARAAITFGDLETALRRQNTNISAGASPQGKRDVVIRTMGQFESLDDIRQTVIKTGPGGPIRVGDVAEVFDGFKKRYSFVRSKGGEVLALPAYRETGSNVIEVMEGLKKSIARVNREILNPRGLELELTQVYDETTYIHAAIDLVRSNIVFGGMLAIGVLLLFLRNLRATAVVALSIPIAVIGTFLIIPAAGRNINVVMLAGLAFAVGMVVDNSIVLLENIFRHREMGKSPRQAASDGATEVWGAVLANSLTTIVVFLPIIFVKEEAGQLFQDIAIAICGAVGLSLVVCMTVIPPLAARVLSNRAGHGDDHDHGWIANSVAAVVYRINQSVAARVVTVVGFTVLSIWLSYVLAPKPSYLPSGNQNLIFGFLVTPPGYNAVEFTHIGKQLENGDPEKGIIGIRRFWEAEPDTPEYEALLADWSAMVEARVIPGLEAQLDKHHKQLDDPDTKRAERSRIKRKIRETQRSIKEWRVPPPPIDNFFYVAFGGGVFMGCSSKDPEIVRPLANVLTQAGRGTPDAFPIFFQTSIFGNLGASNSVEIELRGDDLDKVVAAGNNVMMACMQRFGSRPESNPQNFSLQRREDRLIPDRVRAGDLGLTVADIGATVRACGDGLIVGQYRDAGKSIDLAIKVADTQDTDTARSATDMIAEVPVYTPAGRIVPLSAVCRIERTTAPQEIAHIETQRSVKLTVRPPEGVSLPETIDVIENEIIAAMRGEGFGPQKATMAPDVIVSLAGNADKLRTTWDSLKWLLGLSLLVVFLLMAGLFESFAYPFVIILTVPFAVVGGFIGLAVVNAWTWSDPTMSIQQLDMLTVLGFVILLGIVVNNGILLVHQSLNFMSYGAAPAEAIADSVRTRIRPIFMTVMTTFFGQLLLVVRPGSGAELYRGVGAVVLGGLVFSTVFTLIVVPAMLSLFIGARMKVRAMATGAEAAPHGPEPSRPQPDAQPSPVPENVPAMKDVAVSHRAN